MLGFPKNVLASSDPEEPFKYSVVLKGKAFEAEAKRLEVYKPLGDIEDYPNTPGFKDVWIGVPKVDALSTDIMGLDLLISNFDSTSFQLPWYDPKKSSYPAFIRQPEGEITGACVLLHGADNISDIDFRIANELAKKGKLTIIPFLFCGSGKASVSGDQTAIPLEQSVVAAYRMLHFVKSHPDMAGKCVDLIGRSRGAMIADLCARQFYQQKVSPDLQFDRFVMIDGFVLRNEEEPKYTNKPMLFMHGRLDTWTPLPFVERHVRILRDAEYPATLEIFDGFHAFLEDTSIESKGVQTFKNCTFIDRGRVGFTPLVFNPDSNTLMESSDLLGWDKFSEFLMKNVVAEEKVLVGGGGEHTERGLKMLEDFLTTPLSAA